MVMRTSRSLGHGVVALVQAALIASACGKIADDPLSRAQSPEPPPTTLEPVDQAVSPDGTNDPEPENGQTGSAEPSFCRPGDSERCELSLSRWTRALGRVALVRAACRHSQVADVLPICECTLNVASSSAASDAGVGLDGGVPVSGRQVVTYPGSRPFSCSEFARTPDRCLYCGTEFPGCNVDDASSCDAVCADMAGRYDLELQQTFSATSRIARCGERGECEYVTEVDGKCYARDPREPQIPSFDCALSDTEILAHEGERSIEACAEPAAVPCQTADDCPRGLACGADGVCINCSHCQGNDACSCAGGERCVGGACVLEGSIECESFIDCSEGESCLLSGLNMSEGRGNGETRSFCAPSPHASPD